MVVLNLKSRVWHSQPSLFAYLYTYILSYLHTCTLAHLHTYTFTHVHTCILTYLRTYILEYLYTFILAYFNTCTLEYLHTCIPTYLPTFILAYSNICIYLLCIDRMILIFPRYLPDTIQKFSKEPLNAFQIHYRWVPNNIKHLLDSFKTSSNIKHLP